MTHPTLPTVILGAGFLGLFTALYLSHRGHSAPVILIDQKERFCFKPLLYEYLSGEMSLNQVVPTYNDLLQGSEVVFLQDKVQSIDLQNRQVQLAGGDFHQYGNLVLALGSVPAFFAEGAQEHALTFQSQADADAIRNRLQDCLQQAVHSDDLETRRRLLTTAIIGGGPAGVELALTLGDLLPQWYEALGGKSDELRIVLINRGDILQGDINSHLGEVAKRAFREHQVPVELLIGASVTAIRSEAVEFTRNNQLEHLETGTAIWTAGTNVNPLVKALLIAPEHRSKRGQLHVTSTLQLPEYPEVFAAGDCAVIIHPDHDTAQPLPATAQVAYQQGEIIAHNIRAQAQPGHHLKPVHVSLRGTLMKLGIGKGVANLFNKYQIVGRTGQLIRQVTYLELLPTPVHDLNVTREWLREEIFHRHAQHHEAAHAKEL